MGIKRSIAALLLVGGYVLSGASWAAPRESQVKAVYLNGYGKFVTWPDSVFASETAPFNICVIGESPFGNALDLTVKDEKINKHPVQAQYISRQDQIPNCQILYVSESEEIRLANILEVTNAYPILTVSDINEFVQQGGMVQFYLRGNKVRFLIDPATLRQFGLEPNANLLRISDVVGR
jgi:hypothetical protein